jgi:hypothetical protein
MMRAAVLTSVLATTAFAGQPVAARPSTQSVNARIDTLEQPIFSNQDVLNRLGIQRPETSDLSALRQQIAQLVQSGNILPSGTQSLADISVGNILRGDAALSAAVLTNLNSGLDAHYRDVMLMADADGTEDLVADHLTDVSDLSSSDLPSGWMLTRQAISEHTVANGFTNTVYYYGDSIGNVYVGADTGDDFGRVMTSTAIDLLDYRYSDFYLSGDDQIVVTGLAVNPVADLTSFYNVDSDYEFFKGKTGEILYVSFWDTGAGLLINGKYNVVRTGSPIVFSDTIKSGVLAIPIADEISPGESITYPNITSAEGFPVTIGDAQPIILSAFSNVAGIAVDDDGNLYFQQVDLTNFTGANIVKVTSVDEPTAGPGSWQDRSLVTDSSLAMFLTTLSPANGLYGYTGGMTDNDVVQKNLITNYSGTSTTFGNITALAAGPNDILYAAVARSLVPTDSTETQNTEGMFVNPDALGPTPSMIISFADTSGAYDTCSASAPGLSSVSPYIQNGTVPIGDGFADVAQATLTLQAGVNNFRAFILGNGPDVRGTLVGATVSNTLQLDLQVDYTIFSGLAVDEESKVYVISGGTPASVGLNPSPSRGEILLFPDHQPFDRRADAIDLRGNVVPTILNNGTNVGNGLSNRFDYIFYQAPSDQVSFTPIGLSGLSRGFLLYVNRMRVTQENSLDELPNGTTQQDDSFSGPLFFGDFDPSGQIAGGDDEVYPYRGDDEGNAGEPELSSWRLGGFEFIYREYTPTMNILTPTVWNAFYLNSNGSISFGGGDSQGTPTVDSFMNGQPKAAGAWANLNPASRWQVDVYSNTFPVQALGFAGINHFIVRWVNVPSSGQESCNSSNSFSISLYDDGTGKDENTGTAVLNSLTYVSDDVEGPTDLHYVKGVSDTITGYSPRKDGSANICMTYGRMDLLGESENGTQVIAGVTPGHLSAPLLQRSGAFSSTVISGTNLSQAALAGEKPFPWLLGIPIGPQVPGTLFNNPATPYEYFGQTTPTVSQISLADPLTSTFDLRQEGNDPALSSPVSQPDPNRGQVCYYLMNYTILFPVVNK